MTTTECPTCFDTETIDFGGREIACPDCQDFYTLKLTGLAHGLGATGNLYSTATEWTHTTITFRAHSRNAIVADVRRVLLAKQGEARREGLKGRNFISSGATAIAKRVDATR